MRAFSAAGQSLVAMTASSWLITRSSDVLREHAATYSADLMLSEPPIDPTCIEAQRHRLGCVAALPVWHPLCEEEVITPETRTEERRVGNTCVRTGRSRG